MKPNSLFILLFSLLLSAQTGAVAGVVLNGQVWAKRSAITVCFANPDQASLTFANSDAQDWMKTGKPFSFAEETAIREIVETEFTLKKTGIAFHFIGSCGPAPVKADLMIFKNFMETENLGGQTPSRSSMKLALGKPYILMSEGTKGMSANARLSYLEYLQLIVLHEFAHSAGLAHEHNLKEALQDPHCALLPNPSGYAFGTWDKIPLGYSQVGPYDAHSIVNGCQNEAVKISGNRGEITLSSGDRNTLKMLYRAK